MTPQKSRLLFLLELLNRETDEEHPITVAEIIVRLNAEGFSANRHTVVGDINTLMTQNRLKWLQLFRQLAGWMLQKR